MRVRGALWSLLMLAPVCAWGQSKTDWTINVPAGGSVNASPASTSSVTIGGVSVPALYFTNDTTVYGYRADTGAALGSYPTGDVIENFPSAVPLRDGNYYVFVTSQNGFLYKLNATDLTLSASVNVRRATADACTPKDSLVATPTVQLEAYSTADFVYKGLKDVVYVITKHGCGDDSLNQVIAYDAATLTKLWAFNDGGERTMDYGAQGCAIDYDRNALYCGTDLKPGRSQPTLWAISTGSTGHTAGSQLWALNIGAVQTRPQLGKNQLLYVADSNGVLHAFDPTNGSQKWSVNVSASVTSITQNVWAEFRAPYDHLIFVTDTAGALHVVADSYTAESGSGTGALVWNKTFTGAKAMSLAAFAPTTGKIYVGLNDGTMHQLALATKKDEATITVGKLPAYDAGATSSDIILDATFQITDGATDINKMITIADGSASTAAVVKRFSIPIVGTTASDLRPCLMANNPSDPNQPNTTDSCTPWNSPITTSAAGGQVACVVGSATNDCCGVGRCIPDPNDTTGKTGYCGTVPRTNGPGSSGNTNQCNDEMGSCTTTKVCKFGGCVGTWAPSGDCVSAGYACAKDVQRGCGPGKSCYCTQLDAGVCYNYSCVATGDGSSNLSYTYTPAQQCRSYGCPNGGTCDAANNICTVTWSPCGSPRQSCDQYAPANVIAHGGNRTCTNGVCGRQAQFCTVASDSVINSSYGNDGYPAVQVASGIAFGRATTANGHTCTAYISSYGFGVEGKIREVAPNGTVVVHDVQKNPPGVMNGITVGHPSETSEVAASQISVTWPWAKKSVGGWDQSPAIAWVNTPGTPSDPSPVPYSGGSQPAQLACTGTGCPFLTPAFNYFPTAPSSNGLWFFQNSTTVAGGRLVVGNYAAMGDVYSLAPVISSGQKFLPSLLFNNSSGGTEWTSAVAMAPDASLLAKSKGLVRAAHGSKIDFYDARTGMVYVLDLASANPPFSTVGTPSRGGSGAWATRGMNRIVAIISLAPDWLNGTDDTYAEVREDRGSSGLRAYVVQVRGDDYSVRPLPDYTGTDGKTYLGLYSTLGLSYAPPPLLSDTNPPQDFHFERRLSTDTISYIHRLKVGDPAGNANVDEVESYRLPP